jgi:nitrate reductase delta subunit
MMGVYNVLAEAFRYPIPGFLERLRAGISSLPAGPVRERLEVFAARAGHLTLDEWEQLYTRTLDLNPISPPYVGYLLWGDNYARGQFMAQLSQAMHQTGVDLEGELPDHLVPLLRYLDLAPGTLADLEHTLKPALEVMTQSLAKVDPDNLYLEPLAAVLEQVS